MILEETYTLSFITTKLAAEAKTYEEAVEAIDGSLTKLGID